MVYLRNNYVKDATLDQCQDIIAEFDSNQDKTMSYDEFLNCFLPAANQSMRDYIVYGQSRGGYGASSRVVPISVSSMAIRILEREKSLSAKKLEIRRILFKHRDY